MSILLDSDFLIALAKADDSNHKKAAELAKKHHDVAMFISPFVIPEATTVLSYRVSQEAACDFLKDIRKRRISYLPYEEQVSIYADALFLEQKRKRISWIDCYNAALVKIHQFKAIASFDSFYPSLKIKLLK